MKEIFRFLSRKKKAEVQVAPVEQTSDERIGYLANELVKELKASGRSIQCKESDKGFGCLNIWVFNLDSENAHMELEATGGGDGWKMKIIPTFKEF